MFDTPVESEPDKEYGEFDVYLEYVSNGEQLQIRDTVICIYRGRACDGRGLHNDWSYALSSGKSMLFVRDLSEDRFLYKPTVGCRQLMSGQYSTEKSIAMYYREGAWNVDKVITEEILNNEYRIKVTNFSINKSPNKSPRPTAKGGG